MPQGHREEIRRRLFPAGVSQEEQDATIIILALCLPSQTEALKLAIWTACMLRVAIGRAKLVLMGTVDTSLRERLAGWEQMWLSEGIVMVADLSLGWDDLLAASDVGLSTESSLSHRLLLQRVQAQGKTVVSVPGDPQLPVATGARVIVAGREARSLAGAILKYLEQNGRVFETVGL